LLERRKLGGAGGSIEGGHGFRNMHIGAIKEFWVLREGVGAQEGDNSGGRQLTYYAWGERRDKLEGGGSS